MLDLLCSRFHKSVRISSSMLDKKNIYNFIWPAFLNIRDVETTCQNLKAIALLLLLLCYTVNSTLWQLCYAIKDVTCFLVSGWNGNPNTLSRCHVAMLNNCGKSSSDFNKQNYPLQYCWLIFSDVKICKSWLTI